MELIMACKLLLAVLSIVYLIFKFVLLFMDRNRPKKP